MGTDFTLHMFAGWFTRDGGAPARNEAEAGTAAAGEGPNAQGPGSSSGPLAGPAGSYIGPGVRLVGSLRCHQDITVQGCVEGPVSAKGQVVVERGGLAEGDITAAMIRVRGRTRGTLVATTEVTLEAGGEHRGGLHAPSLVVELGALVDGEVKVGPNLPAGEAPPGDTPGREGQGIQFA